MGQNDLGPQAGVYEPVSDTDELLEAAWGLIANAGGGDWSTQTPEWRAAAARWRDSYHAANPPELLTAAQREEFERLARENARLTAEDRRIAVEVERKREADAKLAAAVREAEAQEEDEAPAPRCKHGRAWCLECDATP